MNSRVSNKSVQIGLAIVAMGLALFSVALSMMGAPADSLQLRLAPEAAAVLVKRGLDADQPAQASAGTTIQPVLEKAMDLREEPSDGAVHDILGSDAFSGVLSDKLAVQVTAEVEVTSALSSAVAAAFIDALEKYWHFYTRMKRMKDRSFPGIAGGDLLFAVLPDLPKGVESGNILIQATPSSTGNSGGVTFLYHRSASAVEVHIGAREWDIVLMIKESAVDPQVWRNYAATRGVGASGK